MTRYYFQGHMYHHFAELCNAYRKVYGHLPLKAAKVRDGNGNWILAYQ